MIEYNFRIYTKIFSLNHLSRPVVLKLCTARHQYISIDSQVSHRILKMTISVPQTKKVEETQFFVLKSLPSTPRSHIPSHSTTF